MLPFCFHLSINGLISLFRSATVLKDNTATSGDTERRSTNASSGGRRNGNGGGRGGQAALKLENPMKLQRIPVVQQPRRNNNGGGRRDNDRNQNNDRGPRQVASASTDGSRSSGDGGSDYKTERPKKTFAGRGSGGKFFDAGLFF